MNTKALTEIDFFRIRDEVAGYCVSKEAQEILLKREPLTKHNEVEQLKNLSREWCSYLSTVHTSPISGWEPIHPLYAVIKTNGACLSLEQVHFLGQFTLSVKKVREAVENHKVSLNLKLLSTETEKLPDMAETEKKIFRVITPDGELRDLPEITAIRKEIASLNAKIKNIMQGFTSDQKLSNALESSVPVLHDIHQ